MRCVSLSALFVLLLWNSGACQSTADQSNADIKPEVKEVITSDAPRVTSRTIIQDKEGTIWIAAFNGVFKFDGKSFINVGGNLTTYRFSSVLEDKQGNFWFTTLGAGAYHYNGHTVEHYTTHEGLLNDEIQFIFEDRTGDIWFGVNGGISRYNGKTFRNYILNGDSMTEDKTGKSLGSTRPSHEVTSIIEDKAGRIWLGTRDHAFVFDGETFVNLIHNGQPLTNIRSLIEDKNGNIWLGGQHGLWRYDGATYTKISDDPVIYVFEDRDGNIWTGSQTNHSTRWVLSRYESARLLDQNPTVSEILSRPVIWGIFQASDGSMWIAADGVLRYDGKTITHYKNNEDRR